MEPEKLNAYGKSKTLAEKAAWDYVKELPGTSQANRQQFQLQFGHTIIINISIVTTFYINFKISNALCFGEIFHYMCMLCV